MSATDPMVDGRPITLWRGQILARLRAGARFAGLFGTTEPSGCRVTVILTTGDGFIPIPITVLPDRTGALRYPALSTEIPAAFWYERALHDLSGVIPVGHPRLDPLLLAVPDGDRAPRPGMPLRSGRLRPREEAGTADVSGRGVFTIPFGPVRSGIVESIEFLIETPGEDIPHLNIRPHREGAADPNAERDHTAASIQLGYTVDVVEVVEKYLYRPAAAAVLRVARQAKRLQSGRLDAYMAYMLLALITVLAVVTAIS